MKVLCIAVHPDDETLGCGGTLLRHREEGDEIYWLIVTQTYKPQWSQEVIDKKAKEVSAVSTAYGMSGVFRLGFPTVRLDTVAQAELIGSLREVIDKVSPQVVYLVHDGDVHTDHHAVFLATMSVLKAFYMNRWGLQKIYSYETLSSTEAAAPQFHRAFIANVYRDITPYLEKKIEIMALYESETQEDPMPRGPTAIRALGRIRGAAIGVEYAECFSLIRDIC
jgi:N-acetylglucosamine malate deacetylase 1